MCLICGSQDSSEYFLSYSKYIPRTLFIVKNKIKCIYIITENSNYINIT